jgi:hypothetical protein
LDLGVDARVAEDLRQRESPALFGRAVEQGGQRGVAILNPAAGIHGQQTQGKMG